MPTGARAVETRRDVPAEVSRGHSSRATRGEGPNRNQTMETAPLTLVARQKESLESVGASLGVIPSETGCTCTSVSSWASGKVTSIESQTPLRCDKPHW